jgi:hypothetical protein
MLRYLIPLSRSLDLETNLVWFFMAALYFTDPRFHLTRLPLGAVKVMRSSQLLPRPNSLTLHASGSKTFSRKERH